MWSRDKLLFLQHSDLSEIFQFAGKVQLFPRREMWWQHVSVKSIPWAEVSSLSLAQAKFLSSNSDTFPQNITVSESQQCFSSKHCLVMGLLCCSSWSMYSHGQQIWANNFWQRQGMCLDAWQGEKTENRTHHYLLQGTRIKFSTCLSPSLKSLPVPVVDAGPSCTSQQVRRNLRWLRLVDTEDHRMARKSWLCPWCGPQSLIPQQGTWRFLS